MVVSMIFFDNKMKLKNLEWVCNVKENRAMRGEMSNKTAFW